MQSNGIFILGLVKSYVSYSSSTAAPTFKAYLVPPNWFPMRNFTIMLLKSFGVMRRDLAAHRNNTRGCVKKPANNLRTENQILSYFEPLTSSYVLILIAKANFNGLYNTMHLSRSIRPNKYPKIECQI